MCRTISDEVAHYELPHPGLHCLQIKLFSFLALFKCYLKVDCNQVGILNLQFALGLGDA